MIFSLTSFPMSGRIAKRASPVNTGSYRKAWSGRSRNGQTISIPYPPRTLTLWRPVRNSLGRRYEREADEPTCAAAAGNASDRATTHPRTFTTLGEDRGEEEEE